MTKAIYTIFSLFFFSYFSFSQTGEDELYVEYKKADKELNMVYNKLKKKLGATDQVALINAQKAWIRFRELNCKFRSKEDSEGGVISNKFKIDCLIYSTLERTKELNELLEGF